MLKKQFYFPNGGRVLKLGDNKVFSLQWQWAVFLDNYYMNDTKFYFNLCFLNWF